VRANQDFTETELLWLEKIAAENKVILNIFTKPYTLLPITNFEAIEGLVVSYQNSEISQVVSAELLFGTIGSKGKLQKLNRTGFTAPTNDDANTND
jgi:hypothetical protein